MFYLKYFLSNTLNHPYDIIKVGFFYKPHLKTLKLNSNTKIFSSKTKSTKVNLNTYIGFSLLKKKKNNSKIIAFKNISLQMFLK